MNLEEKIETLQSTMNDACTLCDDYFGPDPECDEHCIRLNTINEASAALRKAEKYAWHDLRKNPEDKPVVAGRKIRLCLEGKDWCGAKRKEYCDGFIGYGDNQWYVLDITYMRKSKNIHDNRVAEAYKVIAWKEIEPFEVEE